jgi:hypothetical protein
VINPTTKLMFFRENIPSTETLIYIYIYTFIYYVIKSISKSK